MIMNQGRSRCGREKRDCRKGTAKDEIFLKEIYNNHLDGLRVFLPQVHTAKANESTFHRR